MLVFFIADNGSLLAGIVEDITCKYDPVIQIFKELDQQKDIGSQSAVMSRFFLTISTPSDTFLKSLHKDISLLQKEIKKLKKQKKEFALVETEIKKLKNLVIFIKKHRLQHDVVIFHEMIHNRWQLLFQALVDKEDIASLLPSVGFNKIGQQALKEVVKKVEKDLRKIDEYEYRLHSDWIDLKLANYVLKIELIRLRNAALFHPLYKGCCVQLPSTYPR